jgi:hypothetical protein
MTKGGDIFNTFFVCTLSAKLFIAPRWKSGMVLQGSTAARL